MAIGMTAEEVYEMALEIERNGARFYRGAAEKIEEPDVRALLLKLAAMEDGHEAQFAQLKKKLGEDAAPGFMFDPGEEAEMYLRAAADTHVFVAGNASDLLANANTAKEVLLAALVFEKDTVVFFTSIAQRVSEGQGKADITRLVNEELSHIVMLYGHLGELKS
jgi:rubrerythrin